jgi:hypothetical protein
MAKILAAIALTALFADSNCSTGYYYDEGGSYAGGGKAVAIGGDGGLGGGNGIAIGGSAYANGLYSRAKPGEVVGIGGSSKYGPPGKGIAIPGVGVAIGNLNYQVNYNSHSGPLR